MGMEPIRPPWPVGERAPWAEEVAAGRASKPTIWQAARRYPGRALFHASAAVMEGAMAALVTLLVITWIFPSVPYARLTVPGIALWIVASIGCWCLNMDSENRGIVTFSQADGDF